MADLNKGEGQGQGFNESGEHVAPLERPIEDLVLEEDLPKIWVTAQNAKVQAQQRHWLNLTFLMEERFAVEREQFLSELRKRHGEIDDTEGVEAFIGMAQSIPGADTILRDTAPGAVKAANDYLETLDLDGCLKECGIPEGRISSSLREQLMLTQAFSCRVAGEEYGRDAFIDQLARVKDSLIAGLGDKRVGLAISGGLMGMAVVAGTGPMGLIITGMRFTQKLFETEQGQRLQKKLAETCKSFLKEVGVPEEFIEKASNKAAELWAKTGGSKWGRTAMVGVGLAAGQGFLSEIDFQELGKKLGEALSDGKTGWDEAMENAEIEREAMRERAESFRVLERPVENGNSYVVGSEEKVVSGDELRDITEQSRLEGGVKEHADPAYYSTLMAHSDSAAELQDAVKTLAEGAETTPAEVTGAGVASAEEVSITAAVSTSPVIVDIRAGDTLWEIAESHYEASHPGVEPNPKEIINLVNEISAMNDIEDPNLIFAGQTLTLPGEVAPDKEVITGRIDWLKTPDPEPVTSAAEKAAEWQAAQPEPEKERWRPTPWKNSSNFRP